MTRQSTSKEWLEMDWDFIVPKQMRAFIKSGKTRAEEVYYAIEAAAAFKQLAGNDRRPLLVLREWPNAVLNRRFAKESEKTLLLAKWFHCVKLPPSVLHKTHPFRKIFAKTNPAPMFLAMPDGSGKVGFDGTQSQSKLHKTMTKFIEQAYAKRPKKALQSMLRFLSKFDKCDNMISELRRQIRKERLAKGPKSRKLVKLRAKLAQQQKEKAQAMKMAKAVCDLKLKVDDKVAKR